MFRQAISSVFLTVCGLVCLFGSPRGVSAKPRTAAASRLSAVDTPPTLTITSPAADDLVRPVVHLAATCQDDDPAGCTSLVVTLKRNPFDSQIQTIASGTSSIDLDVSLLSVDGLRVILTFIGRDSLNQVTSTTRFVYVETNLRLTETIRTPGLALADSATRTLYSDVNGQVSLLDKGTGQTTVVLGGQAYATERPYLTSTGAMFVARPASGDVTTNRLYEWRNGALLNLGFPNSADSLRVSGDYAIWSGTDGAFGLTPGLFLRNLATGTNTTIEASAGNNTNDVAANGDVAYWNNSYQIVRYRGGVKTPLTPPGDIDHQSVYPVTDGVNIAYKKSGVSVGTLNTWLITPAGEVALDPDFADPSFAADAVTPFDYVVANGWTAFTRRAANGSRNLWTRSPAGIETQQTFYTDSARIMALNSDGRVAFLHGARMLVTSPGTLPVDVGGNWPVFWRDNKLFAIIGRSVMQAQTTAPSGYINDFDGDGKTDLAQYRANGEWAIIQSANGSTTSTFITNGSAGNQPVPGDYDGDGRQDPAVYREATGNWTVRRSSTNYTTSFTIHWGGPGYAPVPGDYDGDHQTDLAIYQRNTGSWQILKSSTGYTDSTTLTLGGPGYAAVPGQDFDGDGTSDIASYEKLTGVWHIRQSSTGFATSQIVTWGGVGYSLVPGDYDGDGRADLGLYKRSSGVWQILLSTTNYTTGVAFNWGGGGYLPVPGDYDHDGKIDLGAFQRATGTFYFAKSSTSYTTSQSIPAWGNPYDLPVSFAIVVGGDDRTKGTDFDGDLESDITVYNAAANTWYSLGSTTDHATPTITTWGGAGYVPAPGDFDGDGRTDLGTYQQSTGNWSILLSTTGGALSRTIGGPGWVPVVGDYDGDGKSDVAAYNTSTGVWQIVMSAAQTGTPLTLSWGGTGFIAAPGDFDGDGKTDLSVYHTASGTWWVALSSSGYATSLSRTMGGAGDTPAQGDYDGDGKMDLAVYNTTSGVWHGLTSSTAYTGSFAFGWGGTGFTAVPGDYDNDGKTDLVAYQVSSGTWYIALSGTGYTTTLIRTWGGPSYTPVPGYS